MTCSLWRRVSTILRHLPIEYNVQNHRLRVVALLVELHPASDRVGVRRIVLGSSFSDGDPPMGPPVRAPRNRGPPPRHQPPFTSVSETGLSAAATGICCLLAGPPRAPLQAELLTTDHEGVSPENIRQRVPAQRSPPRCDQNVTGRYWSQWQSGVRQSICTVRAAPTSDMCDHYPSRADGGRMLRRRMAIKRQGSFREPRATSAFGRTLPPRHDDGSGVVTIDLGVRTFDGT